jgi:lipase ATG15
VDALKNKNRYYYAAQEIYRNVTKIYPDADIWLVGHSLGGATNSLVALTYGLPAVTFEAPGEAMAAKRLGLPTPPGYRIGAHQQRPSTAGFHFGHTADPIFMGSCNTYGSVCTIAGYAMESVCHSGQTCIYDTVGDLGWRVGAGTHKISSVIKDVIVKYPTPANCTPMVDCNDCYNWEYFEGNHSDTTTSKQHKTSTTSKATRTSTCKTPGWWGCLDETTTTDLTTTTTSKKSTTTTTTTSEETTTTCIMPGWFGCKDKTTTEEKTATVTSTSSSSTAPVTTTTCHTKGWYGGCKDATTSPSTEQSSTITPPPETITSAESSSTPAVQPSTCASRNWYGKCTDWRDFGEVKWDL